MPKGALFNPLQMTRPLPLHLRATTRRVGRGALHLLLLLLLRQHQLKNLFRSSFGPNELFTTDARSAPNAAPWEYASKILGAEQELGDRFFVIGRQIPLEKSAEPQGHRTVLGEVRRKLHPRSLGIHVYQDLLVIEQPFNRGFLVRARFFSSGHHGLPSSRISFSIP